MAAASAAATDYRRFLQAFRKARGAIPIFVISLLYSFGSGCVIGVVRVDVLLLLLLLSLFCFFF